MKKKNIALACNEVASYHHIHDGITLGITLQIAVTH